MSQGHCQDAERMLKGWGRNVGGMQGRFRGNVTGMLQGCRGDVTGMIQDGCHRDAGGMS